MPPKQPVSAREILGDFAPKLLQLTNEVLFGDIWERPGLSKRDRSLITVSALVALNRTEQLRFHIRAHWKMASPKMKSSNWSRIWLSIQAGLPQYRRRSLPRKCSGRINYMHDKIYDSICEVIGSTPIIRLKRIPGNHWAEMLVKLESLNPGGSVKDRIGLSMIEAAERAGVSSQAARSLRPPAEIPALVWRWFAPLKVIRRF